MNSKNLGAGRRIVLELYKIHQAYLTEEEKHQIALWLIDTSNEVEVLDNLSRERLTAAERERIVDAFAEVWSMRQLNHIPFVTRRKLCPILHDIVMDGNYTKITMLDKVKMGVYCSRHGLVDNALQVYLRLKEEDKLRNEYSGFDMNIGMAKLFAGDMSGVRDITKSTKQVIESVPMYKVNPKGKAPPYSLQYLDELENYPNKTIHVSTKKVFALKKYIPKQSGLALPKMVEFVDRDINLITFNKIHQEYIGVFWDKDNDFIFYDGGAAPGANYFFNRMVSAEVIPPPTEIREAVLVTAYQYNYYHWLIEGLAKVVHLMEIGFFDKNQLAGLVCDKHYGYIEQMLALVNFPKSRIIRMYGPFENVLYRKLHYPVSVPWVEEKMLPGNPTQMHLPPPPLLQLLNKRLNPNPLPLKARRKVIYAGRAAEGSRKTLFDVPLIHELEKIFGSELVVFPNPPPSVSEQRTMFSEARIIVGAHGAALSNMIFAAPNETALIVFPVSTILFDPPFSNIAASLGMYFWTLPAVETSYYFDYEHSPTAVADIVKAVVAAATFMKQLE